MLRTVGDLRKAIEGLPEDMEIGFCSYNGGHMYEIGAAEVEKIDDGASPDMFVLYTRQGEEALMRS